MVVVSAGTRKSHQHVSKLLKARAKGPFPINRRKIRCYERKEIGINVRVKVEGGSVTISFGKVIVSFGKVTVEAGKVTVDPARVIVDRGRVMVEAARVMVEMCFDGHEATVDTVIVLVTAEQLREGDAQGSVMVDAGLAN